MARNRRVLLFACLFAGGLLAAQGAPNDAFDLPQLMAALARSGSGTVHFTEVKTVAILKRPIELAGTLSYTPPARLERHTVKPREERYVIDGDTLTIERPAQRERVVVRLADYPAVRAFAESMRGTLAGDLESLRRYYRVELEGAKDDWRLYLLPSDEEMAQLVQRVLIGGRAGRVTRIEILETSGDRSVMTLTEKAGA